MGDPKVRDDCYICDRPTEADDFCPGCTEWFCKECDEGRPVEPHEPDRHKTWASD